jgi:Txe/YoeB family toxin of Txe-Axe toxin-antitoxin module
LCQNCANLVDNDERRCTADVFRAWKLSAERRAADRIEKNVLNLSRRARGSRTTPERIAGAVADIKSRKIDAFHVLATLRHSHDLAIVVFRHYVQDYVADQLDETVTRRAGDDDD